MSDRILSDGQHFEVLSGIPIEEMSGTMHEIGKTLGSTTFELAMIGRGDPEPLRIHSESVYHERMCSYFLLGCVEQADVGGDNTVYDGVRAAEIIKAEAPDLVDATMVYHAEHYEGTKAVVPLVRNLRGDEDALYFRQRYPYNEVGSLPDGWSEDTFYDYLDDVLVRSVELQHRLEPGELLVVDNYKTLHGRDPYEGQRKMLRVRVDDPAFDAWVETNNLDSASTHDNIGLNS